MKKRLYISGLLIVLLLAAISIISMNFPAQLSIVYGVIVSVLVILILFYLFNGMAKFLVMLIYSLLIIFGLFFFEQYQTAIIVLGTFLILLNPLVKLEKYIANYLTSEDVAQLNISVRGNYWPYYEYRQAMKDYLNLPQTKKLFTLKWYLRLRQLTVILLFFFGLYLFINELKNIYFETINYESVQFLIFYGVIGMFISAFILIKSGFNAMFETAIGFIFFPIIIGVLLLDLNFAVKAIFSSVILVMAITYIIHQKYESLQKVAFNSYEYYDPSKKRYVYANQFYEPLVYNETYTLTAIYKFQIDQNKFSKALNDLLVYANYKHFMITAYTFDGKFIELYTEFYKKDVRKVHLLHSYLEKNLNIPVNYHHKIDKEKIIYESEFFHRPEYIIARATNLVDLMESLEVDKEDVIVTMIYTFSDMSSIEELSKLYYITRLESFEQENYYVASISIKTSRNKFQLEQKIRDILLNTMIYKGIYVRIMVYYEGVKE